MKKSLKKAIFISLALGFALVMTGGAAQAANTNQTLKGQILLQVQDKGQAWYVSPSTGAKVSLGSPAAALSVIQKVGLGITNSDLQKIPVAGQGVTATSTNTALGKKLAGQILLQVQDKGQAWYVNPANNERYYLGTPAAALSVMQTLGLGITNSDLNNIKTVTSPVATAFAATPSLTASTPSLNQPGLNLSVAKNPNYSDQTVSPNTSTKIIAEYIVNGSPTEDVKLSALNFNAAYSVITAADITNVKVYDASGTQIGATMNGIGSLNTPYLITKGTSVTFGLVADIGSASSGSFATSLKVAGVGASTGQSYQSNLAVGQLVSIRQLSADPLMVIENPAYANQTLAPNTAQAKIASYVVTNRPTSGASITINILNFGATYNTLTAADFTNVKVYDQNNMELSGSLSGIMSFDNLHYMIAPGASVIFNLYADIGSAPSGSLLTSLKVLGQDQNGNSLTSNLASGQTITIQ